MKTILTLLIAGVLINGSVRAGLAGMRYYQLKETAQQAVLFGAGSTTADIRQTILEKAGELDLPLDPEHLTVGRQATRTWANGSYRHGIEVFPNQPYYVNFEFSVEGYSMVLGK